MSDTTPAFPTLAIDDGLAIITLDDGKANVVSPAVLDALNAHLDRAETDARGVVIVGRPGRFSAGFDLSVMTESDESMRSLVSDGAELLCRMWDYPLPVVSACTGHALAMGALMLLASDVRIGEEGAFKLGLTEVSIGMPLPIFAIEFARARMPAAHFTRATLGAQVYDPAGAVAAGYLDRAVPTGDVIGLALTEARTLAGYRTGAYARSKHLAHQALIDLVRSTLADDLGSLTGPTA